MGLCMIDVLALLHRRHADHAVQMVGRHDLDGIEILFLVQQFAEVGVGGTAARCAVIRLDDVLADVAAARDGAFAAGAPVGLIQCRAGCPGAGESRDQSR